MKALLTRQQVADHLGVHVNQLDKIRTVDPTCPRLTARMTCILPERLERSGPQTTGSLGARDSAWALAAAVYG